MDDTPKLLEELLSMLKEQRAVLLDLDARMRNLDNRLELLRLEGLSALHVTWESIAEISGEGKRLMRKLQKAADGITRTGLSLLAERDPGKAAALQALRTVAGRA